MTQIQNLDQLMFVMIETVKKQDSEFYNQLYDSYMKIMQNEGTKDLKEYDLCVESGMLALGLFFPGMITKKRGLRDMKKRYKLITSRYA